MMRWLLSVCILLFGLVAVWLRGVRLVSLLGTLLGFLVLPVGLWRHGSVGWPSVEVRDVDFGFWPYSVGLLVKLCSFVSSLQWPSVVSDLGLVFRSLNCLFFTSGGLERGWSWRCRFPCSTVQFQCRLFLRDLIFGVPAGFWVSILRALGGLPGGLGRFLPCRLGANHCRLRSVGWARCGHGLTSRPLEASGIGFLDDLLSLFGYPSGSGQFLVDGSLRMRYCSAFF